MEDPVTEYGVRMTDSEVREYLSAVGDGVLSFGGNVPYGIPISTAFDAAHDRLVFHAFFGTDSQKQPTFTAGEPVSFTAYEWHDVDDWRSVIVPGRLRPLDWDDTDRERVLEVYVDNANVTDLAIFDERAINLTSEWYELDVAHATGRKAPVLPSHDESDNP